MVDTLQSAKYQRYIENSNLISVFDTFSINKYQIYLLYFFSYVYRSIEFFLPTIY